MTRSLFLAAAAMAVIAGPAAAATQVHALTISGQAQGGTPPFGCATSGRAPGVSSFFGAGVPVPTEGHAGCGLAGGIQDVSKASGLATASSSVVGNVFNGGTNDASAEAKASEGLLGVSASESFAGGTKDAASYFFSEAGAIFSDSQDLSALGLGMVSLRFGFDIDGSMSLAGAGEVMTFLNYQIGAGTPIYTAFTSELGSTAGPRAINPTGVGPLAGFTVTPTSVSGADRVYTFEHLVDLSRPFDMTFGLYTAAYGSPNSVQASNFFHTARLSFIEAKDLSGRVIDFSFTGASGTVYDATGAHAPIPAGVPEPSQWALLVLGFGLGGLAIRQRRRHPVGNLRPRLAAVHGQRPS